MSSPLKWPDIDLHSSTVAVPIDIWYPRVSFHRAFVEASPQATCSSFQVDVLDWTADDWGEGVGAILNTVWIEQWTCIVNFSTLPWWLEDDPFFLGRPIFRSYVVLGSAISLAKKESSVWSVMTSCIRGVLSKWRWWTRMIHSDSCCVISDCHIAIFFWWEVSMWDPWKSTVFHILHHFFYT